MNCRQRLCWASVALALVLAISAPLTAGAQTPQGASLDEPYTPAKDAKDLRSVLFNWMWHQGMLKGHDERDMVATLEYKGTGTIQVDGQPCNLTRFRASTNYQTYAQRIQYACTRGGQRISNIEVVSGLYAWNEDVAGAEIGPVQNTGPTKGKATPMANAVQERLIRIWASPQGAPKAAVAGTTDTLWWGANPGTLLKDGVDKVGQTSLVWQAGKPVVTFPIPGIPGAMATATLDAKYMVEKVVVTSGTNTTEFTYSNYQDWNNPLNKIEVFYAGKMTERRNGTVVRDLTSTETETGNVYVVAPVPASVRAAITPAGQIPKGVWAKPEIPADTSKPTPQLAGKPDFTGVWQHTDWWLEGRMTKWTLGCVALCGLLLAGTSLQAHHSRAGMYAIGKEAKVSGAFKAFRLINPHSSMKIDVTARMARLSSGISSAAACSSSRGSASAGPAPIHSRPGTRSSSRTCRRWTERVRSGFWSRLPTLTGTRSGSGARTNKAREGW